MYHPPESRINSRAQNEDKINRHGLLVIRDGKFFKMGEISRSTTDVKGDIERDVRDMSHDWTKCETAFLVEEITSDTTDVGKKVERDTRDNRNNGFKVGMGSMMEQRVCDTMDPYQGENSARYKGYWPRVTTDPMATRNSRWKKFNAAGQTSRIMLDDSQAP